MRRAFTIVAGALVMALAVAPGFPARAVQPSPDTAVRTLPPTTITVSAAASLTDVLPVIAKAFSTRYPNITVRFNFGGSNALVEQVRAGAPADVLATASEPVMQRAVNARLVATPWLFARNTMTIAVPPGNPGRVRSLADLARVTTALCAVQVPCGAASRDLLARNGVTVLPVSRELDVRDVLGKVMADQVDAGLVYATDVRAVGRKVQTITIPASANVTTTYPIAVVSASANQVAAQAFVHYVRFTPSAQGILRAWGFGRPW